MCALSLAKFSNKLAKSCGGKFERRWGQLETNTLSQPVDTDVTTRSRNRGSLVGEQHTSSSKKNASTFATSETLSLSLELISGALLSI
jgi:hypothetical protein